MKHQTKYLVKKISSLIDNTKKIYFSKKESTQKSFEASVNSLDPLEDTESCVDAYSKSNCDENEEDAFAEKLNSLEDCVKRGEFPLAIEEARRAKEIIRKESYINSIGVALVDEIVNYLSDTQKIIKEYSGK